MAAWPQDRNGMAEVCDGRKLLNPWQLDNREAGRGREPEERAKERDSKGTAQYPTSSTLGPLPNSTVSQELHQWFNPLGSIMLPSSVTFLCCRDPVMFSLFEQMKLGGQFRSKP